MFSFDRVFYEKSEQVEVYEFLALPIVRGIIQKLCYIMNINKYFELYSSETLSLN